MEKQPTRFIQYTIGNPMIAITMIEHDIEAGLDVPVRLAIYEHADGRTRLVFNKPSSLMSGLNAIGGSVNYVSRQPTSGPAGPADRRRARSSARTS